MAATAGFPSLDGLRPAYRKWVEMEMEATSIRSHLPLLISGLLQVPAYTREVVKLDARRPRPLVIAGWLLEIRSARQARVDERQVPSTHVIGEAALRRMIGSRRVMFDQVQHLIGMASLTNITILVVPHTAPAYFGWAVGYTILDQPDGVSRVVYEIVNGSLIMEPELTVDHEAAFESGVRAALSRDGSLEFLYRLRDEYWVGV